jgi:hypothetical protein
MERQTVILVVEQEKMLMLQWDEVLELWTSTAVLVEAKVTEWDIPVNKVLLGLRERKLWQQSWGNSR